jgi:hypothetical protein
VLGTLLFGAGGGSLMSGKLSERSLRRGFALLPL